MTPDVPGAAGSGGETPPAPSPLAAEMLAMQQTVADYVQKYRDWYQKHKRPHRIAHRAAGSTVVGLGAAIPLINALSGPWARFTASAIGVAISVITGLSAFYRWERSWRSYSLAQFQLEFLLRRWELSMAQARNTTDGDQALTLARKATRDLLEDARKVQVAETSDFFQHVSTPKDVVHKP